MEISCNKCEVSFILTNMNKCIYRKMNIFIQPTWSWPAVAQNYLWLQPYPDRFHWIDCGAPVGKLLLVNCGSTEYSEPGDTETLGTFLQ